MKVLLHILIALLILALKVGAQNSIDINQSPDNGAVPNGGCGTDNYLRSARKNASFRSKEAIMNRQILSQPVVLGAQFTLPVVFHIISDDSTNVDDSIITAALKDLNDAFGKTGAYSASKGADTKIRFCLAKEDPDGGITTGITRTTSFFSNDLNKSIEDDKLKNLITWDPEHYINIYYVKNIQDENFVYFTCGLLDGSQWRRIGTAGYATMPSSPVDSTDGIVVTAFGPVLAHEMGHYLGLYHTFEGGCSNNDCTLSGDRVCDTPPDNTYLPSSCSDPSNTCRTDTLSNYSNGFFTKDVPDQVTNFMDYGNSGCSNEFTDGQSVRMRAAIVGMRSGLLQNKCNPPCAENIIAGFTRDINYPIPGNAIKFTSTSSGAGKFEWRLNGSVVSTSSSFSYSFPDIGKYKLSLKAYNSASCFSIYTDYIIVTCGVTARFYPDKTQIASRIGFITDSLYFTNTSENASKYKWLIGNDAGMPETLVGTAKDFYYTFLQPARYTVRLVASNAACSDTTESFLVPVRDPTPDAKINLRSVDCYEQTKVRVEFNVCNSGYMPIPSGLPITFYDSDPFKPGARKIGTTVSLPDTVRGACCSSLITEIVDVKRAGLKQIYIVFADKGIALPINLPNTSLIERSYANNVDVMSGFNYNVATNPSKVTVLPGDSVQLTALASPATSSSTYRWLPPNDLSCTDCANPILIADSTTRKQVFAKNQFGCFDSGFVDIKVPPAYDYSLSLDKVHCNGTGDSLSVNFTISNSYKRPVLPKGLTVAFYNADPLTGVARLLKPLFTLPATRNSAQASYNTYVKGMSDGKLFAVVNDNGSTIPLKLPNTVFVETNYVNNVSSIDYVKITVIAANTSPVCERDSVQLNASSVAGATFNWSGPAGFTSNQQNPLLIKVSAASAGSYKVTASKDGCNSDSAATVVVVNSAPVITAGSSSPVCETRSFTLTANSTNGKNYSWTGPSGFVSNSKNPVVGNATLASSGSYAVTAKSNNNCISEPVSVVVKVNPLPVPDFTGADICSPETSVQFKNETTISEGSVANWRWSFGDTGSGLANVDSVKDPVHNFSSPGKFLVVLNAVSDKGCSATINKLYAGIHRQPIADFGSDHPNGICANEQVIFNDKSIADEGTITRWIWELGDGSGSTTLSSTRPVTHTYLQEGDYTIMLKVTNDFGCEDSVINVQKVFPIPAIDAGQNIFITEGSSTNLRATGTGNSISYLWSPPTYLSNTSVINPAVNRPLDDITYVLTATSADGCKASDQVLVKILHKIKVPNAFSPNGDGINDVWNIPNLSDYPGCIVDIFDRYGKLVFNSIGYNKPWDGTRSGTPVPVGVYYYIITPKNGVETVNGSVTLIR